jgi:HJR/Mrr/RecB family endonuclease
VARRRSIGSGDLLWLVALLLLAVGLYGVATAFEAITFAPMDNGLRVLTVGVLLVATYVTFKDTDLIRLPAALGGRSPRRGPITPRPMKLEEFLAMTPTDFELAVGELLGRHGYRLGHTGRPGDLAADLSGTDSEGRSVVVQCKRYWPGNNVGSRDIQQFLGMATVHHGASIGIYVTTSDYTRAARALAAEHGIRLVGARELVELTRRA